MPEYVVLLYGVVPTSGATKAGVISSGPVVRVVQGQAVVSRCR